MMSHMLLVETAGPALMKGPMNHITKKSGKKISEDNRQ